MSESPEPATRSSVLKTSLIVGAVLIFCLFLPLGLRYPKWERSRRAEAALVRDGRMLGNGAQQYFLVTGKTQVSFGYNSATGAISGDLTPWIANIQKGLKVGELPIESWGIEAFTLSKPEGGEEVEVWFTDEGKISRSRTQEMLDRFFRFIRGIP